MYLSYEEYQNMGGTLNEATFVALEFEAESYVNYYTFNRLKTFDIIPEEVKRCIYSLLDSVKNRMNVLSGDTSNASIASQSNDGVSVSYNLLSANDILVTGKVAIGETIKRYLCDVKDSKGVSILYRGVW